MFSFFRQTNAASQAKSGKAYEILAAGKPLVSVPISEMRNWPRLFAWRRMQPSSSRKSRQHCKDTTCGDRTAACLCSRRTRGRNA